MSDYEDPTDSEDVFVLITLRWDEYDFITRFDPDRERSVSRAEMVAIMEYVGVCLEEGRVT